MSTFQLAMSGFLLYAIRQQARCRTIGVPVTSGIAHDCVLFVPDGVDVGATDLPVRRAAGGVEVALTQCTLTFGGTEGAGATIDGFDLIAEFDSLCCDAALGSNWSAGSAVDVDIVLPDGRLNAFADELTNTQVWSWDGCGGKPVVDKRLTSLTVYEAARPITRVEIAPRGGGSRRATIVLPDVDVMLGLRREPTDSSARPEEVDQEHVRATRDVCATQGRTAQFGTSRPLLGDVPTPSLVPAVRSFLRGPRVLDSRGRPNCGARQMADTD